VHLLLDLSQLKQSRPSHRYVFTLHTSFDGSFQLFRKDKIHDRWDTCLTDRRKYFVHSDEFNIEAVPSQGSTRVSCL
jgi:hypothetical protein